MPIIVVDKSELPFNFEDIFGYGERKQRGESTDDSASKPKTAYSVKRIVLIKNFAFAPRVFGRLRFK